MTVGGWIAIAVTVCYIAWLISLVVLSKPLPLEVVDPSEQITLLKNAVCASPVCDVELDGSNVGSVTPARIVGINASLIYCKEHS